MVNVASHHSPGAKIILNGVTIPTGQTAAQDFENEALDTVFNHPNVGPFVCRGANSAALLQAILARATLYRVASPFSMITGRGCAAICKPLCVPF